MFKKLIAWLIALLKAKPDPPKPKPGYIVTPGQRIEKDLKVPCKISFDITPDRDGSALAEDVVVWAYTAGMDWAGGNGDPGTMTVRVNSYNADTLKLKVYGMAGFAGEPKLACGWRKGVRYAVTLSICADSVMLIVNGKSVAVSCAVPEIVTLGYGWPNGRAGCLGAKVENVVMEGA